MSKQTHDSTAIANDSSLLSDQKSAATQERIDANISVLDAVRRDDDVGGVHTQLREALANVTKSSESTAFAERLESGERDLFWIADAVMAKTGDSISYRGSIVPLPEKEPRKANLAPGLYAIIGKARSGKSRLAASLQGAGVEYVEIGEPTATSMDRYSLSHVIFAALADRTDVVIDSVKYLITEGRNPGQFGVTARFTEFLTSISVLAARRGVRIFVVVNPYMIPNNEMGVFIDRIESSTSGVIVPVNPDEWLIRSRDRRETVHRFVNGDVDIHSAVSGGAVRAAFFLAGSDLSSDVGVNMLQAPTDAQMPAYDFEQTFSDDQYVGIAASAFNHASQSSWTFKNLNAASVKQGVSSNESQSY